MIFIINASNEFIAAMQVDDDKCVSKMLDVNNFNKPYPKGYWFFTEYMDVIKNHPNDYYITSDKIIIRHAYGTVWFVLEETDSVSALKRVLKYL